MAEKAEVAAAEEYEVTVLSRQEVTTYPKIRQPVVTVMVSYVAAGLPPATVTIPKAEYSLDLEKKLIREDIERRLKIKPETYKV